MKITICGSIAFFREMLEVRDKLEKLGHEVKLPPTEIPGPDGNMISVEEYYRLRKQASKEEKWIWDRKKDAITNHFKKVEWGDVALVLNYDKKGVKGYVGGNTLMEIGVAFFLSKPIYLLNDIPEDVSYAEEILGMMPIVINGDLAKIK